MTGWVFCTKNFHMYFDGNKEAGFKMDNFINVALEAALLEIAGAKNQYSSILKWFSLEAEVNWTECSPMPTSTIFCGRYFAVTSCFVSESPLSPQLQALTQV